jgi:hypothetical protein
VEEADAELVVVEVITTQLVEEEDAEVKVIAVATQLVEEEDAEVEVITSPRNSWRRRMQSSWKPTPSSSRRWRQAQRRRRGGAPPWRLEETRRFHGKE